MTNFSKFFGEGKEIKSKLQYCSIKIMVMSLSNVSKC